MSSDFLKLRVGVVPYINALPLYRHLPYPVTKETPSTLTQMMAQKDLDCALLPVFSFLTHPEYHPLYQGGVIQAFGAVDSVILFVKSSVKNLKDIKTLFLTEESVTSVNLFRVLCRKYWGVDDRALTRVGRDENPDAFLLIGDMALFSEQPGYERLDLSLEWKKHTEAGFIFALWVFREKPDEETTRIFSQAKTEGLKNRGQIIQELSAAYPQATLSRYFTENIGYEATLPALEGLKKFQDSCYELGLIKEKRSLLGF